MTIYILTIGISTFLFYFEEKIKNGKSIKAILILTAVLIPALVAGGRADVVGTDVRTYAEPLQLFANSNNNFTDFINFQGILSNGESFQRFEKGYSTLIYLASRVTPKLSFSLFITELIILGCVVLGIVKFSKIRNISLPIGIFIFFTYFYNLSFNLIRQSMAMFILFYGFSYLVKKEWIKYIIVILVAFLFHNSAIIGFLFLFIYWLLYRDTKRKLYFKLSDKCVLSDKTTLTLILSLIIIVTLFFPFLIKGLLNLFALAKYTHYIPSVIHGSWIDLIIRLPFLVIILIEWKDNDNNSLRYFYLVIAILDICLSQFSGNDSAATVFVSRISWYTSVFYIYIMADMLNARRNAKSLSLKISLILYLCIYWYIFTVILNYNETIPYVFNGF